MISKENLLKNFANEDKDSVIRIYNNLILAKNKDIPVFSKNFCSPNIWSYFVENFNKNDFIVEADGAYDEADRRIISFNNKYFYEYPFICLKITNKSKFKNLTHKDYLGSIMSLGIAKEKLDEIFQKFPLLKNEYLKYNCSQDYVTVVFKNGSVFDVVGALDSTRGGRRNG